MDPAAAPVLIGITGHRDPRPDDLPALRTALAGVFDAVRAAAGPVPVGCSTVPPATQ
jgi:hypothetical protein